METNHTIMTLQLPPAAAKAMQKFAAQCLDASQPIWIGTPTGEPLSSVLWLR